MNMIAWFRRTRPTPPPPPLPTSERVIAALCHFTPEQWEALTDTQRAQHRDSVAWELNKTGSTR